MLTTTVAGRTWDFSHAIGKSAKVGNGFTQPTAVAVASGGVLYVLSRGGRDSPAFGMGRRIGKVTMDEEFLGEFADEDFVWPVDLALDSEGNVYCSDEYRNFVTIYDPDGRRLGQWGVAGSEEGQIRGSSGISFDAEDNLYVVDSFNDRVQKFTKDGQFLMGWGSSGSGEGQFNRPWGITLDRNGDVYVVDWGNNRVQKFMADGRYLMSFGTSAEGAGDLDHPADVAVDSQGDVYVTDWGNNRVQIYDPGGDILTALYGDASEFSKWAKEMVEANPDVEKAYRRVKDKSLLARFDVARGIAIDDQDRIIITDSNLSRLQVYVKVKDYLEPQFNL